MKKIEEEFRPIKGFPGYLISNCGNILSFKRRNPYIMEKTHNSDGYVIARLYKNRRAYQIFMHILVATAFIGPKPADGYEVDHINGIRDDNRVENLQWLTQQQNSEKANAKKVLCVETGDIYDSSVRASRAISKSDRAVASAICTGTRAGGYHWKYI